MVVMKRNDPTRLGRVLVALLLGAALIPALAYAKIIELGQTAQSPKASCPDKPCLAVSRTTGYQTKVGTQRAIFVAPRDGRVVAWTITLGKPTKKQIAFFDRTLGGASSAGITVVRPGRKLYARVTGQSPMEKLKPYFGETVQFPLSRALTVKKGYIVALTVPTWAPALSVGAGNDTSWRASRPAGKCENTEDQTAQSQPGAITRFRCLYRTARLTYTATIVTEPKPND